MPPVAQTYKCPCFRCQGGSKRVTKRSVESHLKHDQLYLQSLNSSTKSARFVESCINETIILLSQIHRGSTVLDTEPDLGRSHPEGSEGAQFSCVIVIDLY